jgi:hypothetical protein
MGNNTEEWHQHMDNAVIFAESIQSDPAYAHSVSAQRLAEEVLWLAEHYS